MRRVFFALKLSPQLQVTIKQWQENHEYLGVRFPPAENLHVTIVPPWEVEDVSRIAYSVLRMVGGNKISTDIRSTEYDIRNTIRFDRVCYGPDSDLRSPTSDFHLIWATGVAPEWVVNLRDRLSSTIAATHEGWPYNLAPREIGRERSDRHNIERPLLLHVTIARFPKHLGYELAKQYPINETVQWQSQITTLALIESRLKNPVAEYETIAEFSL